MKPPPSILSLGLRRLIRLCEKDDLSASGNLNICTRYSSDVIKIYSTAIHQAQNAAMLDQIKTVADIVHINIVAATLLPSAGFEVAKIDKKKHKPVKVIVVRTGYLAHNNVGKRKAHLNEITCQ